MKKILKLSIALLLGLTIVGCSSNDAPVEEVEETTETTETTEVAEGSDVLNKILDSGVLVVATSPDYPPMEFLDENSQPVGSDMMLAQHIADVLGVELKIETMEFAGTLTAVDTGKVDLAISGFGWKEDRAENYELSIGYNNEEGAESSCHTVLLKKEDVEKYPTPESMDGLTIAAQAASLQEMYAKDQIPNVQLEIVQQIDQGVIALQTGKVQGISLSCDIAKGYANTLEDTGIALFEFDLSMYEDYAGNVIAAKKGETALIEKVNEILTDVNETGKFVEWDKAAKAKARELGIDFEE
ncbi:MAG: transporter substrate-binding domain-containing protein [Erysipelotrichaceae bacterium]|jgi:polar amino acid transport system substrate-binding protein|nr:hypothetical protein [Erysipelotrichaceae bacterium]